MGQSLVSRSRSGPAGELQLEVVSASSVRDPEYRVGDFVKSRLQRNACVNLYVSVTFGEQIAHTTVAEADENGEVYIGQTVSFPLARALRNDSDSQIMIRAYDKRDQAQSSHKGDPLIGKAKLCLGEVPYGTVARKRVELERTTQRAPEGRRGSATRRPQEESSKSNGTTPKPMPRVKEDDFCDAEASRQVAAPRVREEDLCDAEAGIHVPEEAPEKGPSAEGPAVTNGRAGEKGAASGHDSGDSKVHGVIILQYTVRPPSQSTVEMTLCVRKPWKVCGP